jgi:hypothetical protein
MVTGPAAVKAIELSREKTEPRSWGRPDDLPDAEKMVSGPKAVHNMALVFCLI